LSAQAYQKRKNQNIYKTYGIYKEMENIHSKYSGNDGSHKALYGFFRANWRKFIFAKFPSYKISGAVHNPNRYDYGKCDYSAVRP
jgi:hypothetical protein